MAMPLEAAFLIRNQLLALQGDPPPLIHISLSHNPSAFNALLIGPPHTPYAGGFFYFHIRIPNNYPMAPPVATLLTTDDGRLDFGSSFLANGEVLLSTLNTTGGERQWTPINTLSAVLISIQALFAQGPHPDLYLDPVDEALYNDYIRFHTLRVAVVDNMRNLSPTSPFRQVIHRTFLLTYMTYLNDAHELSSRLEDIEFPDLPLPITPDTFRLSPVLDSLCELKEEVMYRFEHLDDPDVTCDMAPTPRNPPVGPLSEMETFRFQSHLRTCQLQAAYRLLEEHKELCAVSDDRYSASPRDMDNPFVWDAFLFGPRDTPWEGGALSVELRFSWCHPVYPPFVRFRSNLCHPNVTADGIPALDLLCTKWDPATQAEKILILLCRLLLKPDMHFVVNAEAHFLYRDNHAEYERRIRHFVQEAN